MMIVQQIRAETAKLLIKLNLLTCNSVLDYDLTFAQVNDTRIQSGVTYHNK